MPYAVEFAQSVEEHFRALTARERSTVLSAIDLHSFMNRSRRRAIGNPYGLIRSRPGSYVSAGFECSMKFPAQNGVVRILAVGRKRRNVLVIGGQEIRL